ncbi:MAG: sulfatase [Candidatus Omnitrophota bacterium]|jgi:uncharacterized sulfatase|nr:MAG: sulfatase [Candidatus Omnitrophota bacterium]
MKKQISRRDFLANTSAVSASALMINPSRSLAQTKERPNFLWLTSEDNGPEIGAYGDSFADTPNIDGIAKKGVIYLHAWSTAPVCAPARTTIISGVYPPCTGAEHMRSMTHLPANMKMYPEYLREAGYYCTNNSKEDYNLEKIGQVWDESSNKAHWRNRKEGQPFFAVFNFTVSHESQIRVRPHTPVHDPAKVPIPAYHPDTPEVRLDWAQYYDKLTEMDAQVGKVLHQLHEDGLDEDTIIFYYGDHGSGMPRSKRWLYNSGLRVPLVIHIPEKYKHLAPPDYAPHGQSERLVGFIDLAPTVLSLVGIQPPNHMQGHAFLGEFTSPGPDYLFGFRGRMDEQYDMSRTVRDHRYHYIRNYMPHKTYGQYLEYMFQTPTTQVWKTLYDEGKLQPPQTYFWETKPPEELYDMENDPDEVSNLADSPDHQNILERLRKVHQDWELKIRDVGFLPEDEIHSRSQNSTPYEMGHDDNAYPMKKIMAAAELASSMKQEAVPELIRRFEDKDSAVRYWAAMGILMQKEEAVIQSKTTLHQALGDSSASVQVIAAQALGQYGNQDDLKKAYPVLLKLSLPTEKGIFVSMLALNALDAVNESRKDVNEALFSSVHPRFRGYPQRLLEKIVKSMK